MREPTDNKGVHKFTFKKFLKCIGLAIVWIFIILLVELIIIGVMFHIPWKVLLLLFCLIALAFIPKRIRKYNYVPVIILLTICNIWVLVPDRDHTWVPFTFDAELAKLESQHTIAPEDNAAVIYQAVVDRYKDKIFHPNISDFKAYNLDFDKPFSTASYPELSKIITDQQDTISQLLTASKYDKCHFAIPHDLASIKAQQHRLFLFKCFARLLLHSANNDIGDGRSDEAVTKQLAVLKIADHLYQQQTLLDNSAAAYIELMAIANINTFVMRHCDEPAVIDDLTAHLKTTDQYFPGNWNNIHASLNLLVKNMVGMLYEIHPDGRVRRSHTIAPTINRQFRAKMRISPFQMTIVKAGAIGHWFVLPATPDQAASMIDKAFADYSPTGSENFSMPPKPELELNYKHITQRAGHYSGKWYYSIQTQSKTRVSAARASSIIGAIKKYYLQNDEYPDSLDELITIDPIVLTDAVNSENFVYRKTETDFLLYSTGRNRIDEGGIKTPKLNFDDVRAWPPEVPPTIFSEPRQ
jgi:hypothetical protein